MKKLNSQIYAKCKGLIYVTDFNIAQILISISKWFKHEIVEDLHKGQETCAGKKAKTATNAH